MGERSMDMNHRDAAILELLEQDSRTTPAQIAQMTGMQEGEVKAAIARMEEEGVLLKYTTVVNHEKLADNGRVQALIEVRITPQRERGFDAVAERIYRFEEVKTMYLMSGSYDLMVVLEGTNMRQIALFVSQKLSTLDGVLSTATHFILKKYKDNGVCFETVHQDDRLKVTP